MVSAPPGTGKTVLLRSWINDEGLAGRAGWVASGPDERDPQRFWVSVLAALRRTTPGSALVQALTAAPDLDGWAIVERLLKDLAPLPDRLWLVIDDVHELGPDALRQLELLLMRAPPQLRFVLATRHDVRLGLHRLRLDGELAEMRAADLRFSLAEARELFDAAGVKLPEPALMTLHERTEGWAAGLRLLLRTSVLERVNGELADLLTGDGGGERVLQDLEEANAFVVSLDPARSWFRYHQLFADLLQLELRRTTPGEVAGLHRAASGWFAGQGYPVEAIRHAQAARDWELAARLLADHWPGLHLDGQDATTHELLARFPAGVIVADAELAAVAAADELAHGSLEAAERYLGQAARELAWVPDTRRGQPLVHLGSLPGRGHHQLVARVGRDQRGRGDAAGDLGAGEPHQGGAEVIQVAEDLPAAGGQQERPAVSLGRLGQVEPGMGSGARTASSPAPGPRRSGRCSRARWPPPRRRRASACSGRPRRC